MRTHRAGTRTLAGGVLPLVAMIAGCGSKETTASRSAAAYDEAQRKGVAVAGAAPSPQATASAMPGMDHSATGAKPSDPHAGMDHSGMPGMKKPSSGSPAAHRPAAGMDHSGMAGMGARSQPRADAHAGTDHSKMAGVKPSATAMDHSQMSGTKPSAMSHDMPMPPPSPEPESASARPGQPAAMLRPDPLDQPAPTSVADAARTAGMAAEMTKGGHGKSHGTYRHVDAGRDVAAPSPKPSPAAKEHKH